MVNCCAYQCQSRSEKKEPGISFHSFPRDYEKCKVWVNNMKLKDWSPTKNDRICSKHFEGHWFYKSNMQLRVRLLNEAVPTIFPTLPKYLQPIKAIRRLQQKTGSSISLVPQPETSRTVKKEEQRLPTPLISVPDTPREQELKRKLIKEVIKNRAHQQTIRQLKQSSRRYKKKVLSLKQIIQNLQKKCMCEKSMLIENMNDVNREILKSKTPMEV